MNPLVKFITGVKQFQFKGMISFFFIEPSAFNGKYSKFEFDSRIERDLFKG